MTAGTARVLVPVTVTAAMIGAATTIAEPAAGETAWVSGGTYSLNDEAIRTTTHKVYECVQAHTGRTALPENDDSYWKEKRPTLRWAPFDDYSNTSATATASITYVLQPGFINGLFLGGLVGGAYSVVIKDAPGGSTLDTLTGDLYAQAAGPYEHLYTPLVPLTEVSFDGIPLSPTVEITITITSGVGLPVGIGMIKVGDWRQFIGDGDFGGANYGAQADRKSYTYRVYNPDGTYKTVKRPQTRDITLTVEVDAEQAMYANAILQEITDVAVPFEASGVPRYGFLNTVGFLTASMRAEDYGVTSININVKGNI